MSGIDAYQPNPIERAAYELVHNYPGGAVKLGRLLGINAAVLSNKVHPSQERHRLTLDEAVQLTEITRDLRLIKAVAAEFGHVLQPLDADADDASMFDLMLAIDRHRGRFADELQKALADGQIDEAELARIKQHNRKRIETAMALEKKIEAYAKPKPQRLQQVS